MIEIAARLGLSLGLSIVIFLLTDIFEANSAMIII